MASELNSKIGELLSKLVELESEDPDNYFGEDMVKLRNRIIDIQVAIEEENLDNYQKECDDATKQLKDTIEFIKAEGKKIDKVKDVFKKAETVTSLLEKIVGLVIV
jgi:hypothetical protein